MTKPSLQSSAVKHFNFLVEEYGFVCVTMNAGRARFESDVTFVEILFDGSYTFELDVWFGLRQNDKHRYSIQEVLELNSQTTGQSLRTLQVSTEESMEACMWTLANQVRNHAVDALRGNASVFKALAIQRSRKTQEFTLACELEHARKQARVAWENRDFEGVVNAMEPCQTHLTTAETAKLQYARKRLAQ